MSRRKEGAAYLGETDILTLLPETLPADVEAVFADQTGFVSAHTTGVFENFYVSDGIFS